MLGEGGSLVVTIKRANGIVGADLDGKSDPYVRVFNGGGGGCGARAPRPGRPALRAASGSLPAPRCAS